MKQLVEDFARYLYLPRLAGPEVLVQACRDGVALLTWQTDTFAYAESHDEVESRYKGLRGGQMVMLSQDSTGLLAKPDIARRQIEAEAPQVVVPGAAGTGARKRSASICQGQIKINTEKLLPNHVSEQVALMAAKEKAEYS